MMKSLILILSLFFAADVIDHVYAQLDIKQVLQTLNHQFHQHDDQFEQVRDRDDDKKDDDKKDDDDDDDNRFGSLRAQELEKLIKQAFHRNSEKSNKREVSSNKRQKYSSDNQVSDSANIYTLWQAMNNKQDDDNDDNDDDAALNRLFGLQTNEQKEKRKKKNVRNIQQSYLEQLNQLLQDHVNKPKQNSKKKRLQPNDLLGDTYYTDVINRADPSDLSEYSKVYVILNADAIQQTKNPNRLNDILSTLLKSASSQRDHHGRKEQRYKGFILTNSGRRVSRDSPETPLAKDSELNYKPKRLRSRGGGGGESGGRTPIPYIRHRGDIYEKDN